MTDNNISLHTTKRCIAPALEDFLYDEFKVLDHGFVRVVDYMGNDSAIVQAARVSYGSGTKKVSEDRGLIHYLMRHHHTTPFEMCEIKLHVKLPIFVARQWIRHRTANVNEYSARYSVMDKEFYLPAIDQMALQSQTNKQGRDEVFSPDKAQHLLDILKSDAERCYDNYRYFLNEDGEGNVADESRGSLARELARMNLPTNYYTQWYWKVDLHNLFHFLMLRADHHAQYEIRVYADVILDLVKKWVPFAHEAFEQYRMGAARVSGHGKVVLQKMLRGEPVDQASSGMSAREWREFCESFGIEG